MLRPRSGLCKLAVKLPVAGARASEIGFYEPIVLKYEPAVDPAAIVEPLPTTLQPYQFRDD